MDTHVYESAGGKVKRAVASSITIKISDRARVATNMHTAPFSAEIWRRIVRKLEINVPYRIDVDGIAWEPVGNLVRMP